MPRAPGGRSLSTVSRYLRGIVFPAHKSDLFRHAQRRGAKRGLLGAIELMPDGNYRSMDEVIDGVVAVG